MTPVIPSWEKPPASCSLVHVHVTATAASNMSKAHFACCDYPITLHTKTCHSNQYIPLPLVRRE